MPQLSQAITSLKAKLQPLSFEQRKAVAEQALLRRFLLKANADKGISVLGTIASMHHSLVCLVQYGVFSTR